ncbi:MAG: hypothetical protein AAB365_00310 [Patescibacteria group bacterium]
MKNIFKSIGAVLAGFAAVAFLSIGTDTILEMLGIFPAPTEVGLFVTWMLVLAFIYRSIYAVVGGYVTARLAPNYPMRHVVALGVLGTIGGIAGVVVGWDLSQHWYPIALAVTAFPLVWFGGKLKKPRQPIL